MSGRAPAGRWQGPVLAAGFAFLYAPIVSIVLYSFSSSHGGPLWPMSLTWYRALADDDDLKSAALRSLELALLSASLATALGTLAGVALARIPRFPFRTALVALLAVPIFAPEVLIGFAFLMLFASVQSLTGVALGKTLATLVIAHATLGAPVVALVVYARAMGLDPALEAAARDLGARPLRVLRTVTLPLVAPGILSGFLLALALSFDNVVTSSFLAGPENTTLPMAIFSSVRIGVNPEINAVGTLMICGALGVLCIAGLLAPSRAGTAAPKG